MESNKNGISRRELFKGTAIAATGVAAATMLPGMAQAQSADTKGCPIKPWEQGPLNIAESEIKRTIKADAVVIGAGLTGLSCAISAKQEGAGKVVLVEKYKDVTYRGGHITAFGTSVQERYGIKDVNYHQIIREWVRWAQSRANENLIWMFSRKSGDCMEWAMDQVKPYGVSTILWGQYFKGPDYTEYPITHVFEDDETGERGNGPLVKALKKVAEKEGVQMEFNQKVVKFERDKSGAVSAVIAGKPGNYTRYLAKNFAITAGDYASNKEMLGRYAPIGLLADAQIYFPRKVNTGDVHIAAMQAGAAMQKAEPHSTITHLEAGAVSYGFLHVNALGKRFKDEDTNTQSKSCAKLLEPKGGVAWTIYDDNGLEQVKEQIEKGISGGLFYGQMFGGMDEPYDIEGEKMMRDIHIKQGKVVKANSIKELGKAMGLDAEALKNFEAEVKNYNKMAKAGKDTQYGKRSDLLRPIEKAPFYAGKLQSTLLSTAGGLRTNETLNVLDANDQPIPNLYVAGASAGDFFANDYPTICPGISLGRCLTFGRLVGVKMAGEDIDDVVKSIEIEVP